jgi:anaphase-promoting complex subunit 5
LTKLWEIDSLDALHLFFARRSNLLAKTREEAKKDNEMGIPPASHDMIILSRTSPVGSFVRRARFEFDRLSFSYAQALWAAFVRWRHESRSYWARKNGMLDRWAGDKPLADGESEWGVQAIETLELIAYGGLSTQDDEKGLISSDDVEKLLEFQIDQMQSEFRFARPESRG